MKLYFTIITSLLFFSSISQAAELTLERIAVYNSPDSCISTEIVSIQISTKRLALSCSNEARIDILSIEKPSKPVLLKQFYVSLEEITSIAFHPTENIVAVAVLNHDPFENGKIQIHNVTTGKVLNILQSGVHPDGLAFSPNGKFLVVANEGEAYRYNGKTYESPEGSVTLVRFDQATPTETIQITLEDYSHVDGMLKKSHARKLERVVIGGNSKEEILIPIKDNSPANTEPEYVAFSPDSSKAYVSLQENNGMLIVNTDAAKIEKVFGLGTTTHLADIKDNGKVKFNKTITALREPDGISISPDGGYLLTADEGDTDPKASKTLGKNKPKGGGRTMSVFNATTGELIADTANQLDDMAHAAGLYPDGRSDSKGSEPENIVSFEIENDLYAAVGLERANAIALVSLKDPSKPAVLSVVGVDPKAGKEGQYAPEGLAHYENNGHHYIFSANEKSGTMTVMEVK